MKFKATLLFLSIFLCVAISLFAQAFAANECIMDIQNQTQRVTLFANNIAIKPGSTEQIKYECSSIPDFTVTSHALIASGKNPLPMRLKDKSLAGRAGKSIELVYPEDFEMVLKGCVQCLSPPGWYNYYTDQCGDCPGSKSKK